MKLSERTSTVIEYDLNIDYYHGKDVVHEGCLLILNPDEAWEKISSYTRKNIKKAQRTENLKINKVEGTAENVKQFRTIWFDPNDVTIPDELEPDEIMYMAFIGDELVAGMILTPAGKNLFLHNLGGTEKGKKNSITALLLWNAVNDLKNSGYKYIDVGVSFRPMLYTFFQHWQTASYPIIFEPPFIKPDIGLSPFISSEIASYKNHQKIADETIIKEYFGDKYTILPRGILCIKNLLQYLKIQKNENVAVFTTFDTNYISRCVSETIEHFCELKREIDDSTKAVMVIHEFGYPCKKTLELKKVCESKKIPLIENCAWGLGSNIDKNNKIGDVGDYAIFSLTKMLPLQYGAILKGITITDEENWSTYKTLDYFKREIIKKQLIKHLPLLAQYNEKKVENWKYLFKLFEQDGFESFTDLDENVFPTALMIKMDDFQEVYERYLKFGVETGRYYPGKSIILPIHHNLNTDELDYVYAVFRGRLNLCSSYKRQK